MDITNDEKNKTERTINVLLVEDNKVHAQMIQSILEKSEEPKFVLAKAETLQAGLLEMETKKPDAILLDLFLPDGKEMDTFHAVLKVAFDLPIIVMTALDATDIALKCVQEGAQDYLYKKNLGPHTLIRSILHSIERKNIQLKFTGALKNLRKANRDLQQTKDQLARQTEELKQLTLIDEFTGLYNRRGFIALAEQQIRIAKRRNVNLLLVLINLEYLQNINNSYGYEAGDKAVLQAKDIISDTCRDSDLKARFSGGNFAVLMTDASTENLDQILPRLKSNMERYNENTEPYDYTIELSTRHAEFKPSEELELQKFIDTLNELVYSKTKIL